MKRTTLLLTMMSLLVLFGLVACERPAPGSVAPPATATRGATDINATLLPPLAASPTPAFVATLDPNAPLDPGTFPTTDPNAPPAEQATPEPAPPEATAVPEEQTSPTGEIIHIGHPVDNLFRIGLRYGFTYQELAA